MVTFFNFLGKSAIDLVNNLGAATIFFSKVVRHDLSTQAVPGDYPTDLSYRRQIIEHRDAHRIVYRNGPGPAALLYLCEIWL